MSNYAIKSDLTTARGVDASNFANKFNLDSLKWDVNELDTDQLKNGPSVLDSFKSKLNGDKMKPIPTDFKKLYSQLVGSIW